MLRPSLVLTLAFALGCPSTSEEATPSFCPDGTHEREGLCFRAEGWTPIEPLPREQPEHCSGDRPPAPQVQCASTYPERIYFPDAASMAGFCDAWDCVDGGVEIGGTEEVHDGPINEDITDLSALSCLKSARYVMISRTAGLTDVDLPELERTWGAFILTGNRALASVSAPRLQHIGGDLSVQGNPQLREVDMPALRQIGEFFVFLDNAQLDLEVPRALRAELCDEGVGAATTIVRTLDP